MCLERKSLVLLAILGALAFLASPAAADWNPGDPYKMLNPQLPDPNGLDVNFTDPMLLADDWMCTETGNVSQIHFWFSAQGDAFAIPQLLSIHASIHSDVPASGVGDYSNPGELLWERDFNPSEFVIRQNGIGTQGWYDPVSGYYNWPDHTKIYQANITDIEAPFVQQVGTIYWLDLKVTTASDPLPVTLGWKTSLSHWNDDAVYWDELQAGWKELKDPETGISLDMAFVIVPEPGTLVLLITAGLGLLALARRRQGIRG